MLRLYTHPAFARHDNGFGHPERPERLEAVAAAALALEKAGLLRREEPPEATREQLLRVHSRAYVDAILAIDPGDGWVQLDPDTAMGRETLPAALRAGGAVVAAVEAVLREPGGRAFCAVRPPGHHAERARAMGFCIFNNLAVGAAHALALGVERVGIVDFDVHHGNGTEEIFRDEPRVWLGSSFQHPLYPWSGADTVSDHILNVPLPQGTDGPAFRQAFQPILEGLDRFRPGLVLVSAGFDAHRLDPLAGLRLEASDYGWVTGEIRRIAEAHAEGRIVSVLEGGYSKAALRESVRAHLEELRGGMAGSREGAPPPPPGAAS